MADAAVSATTVINAPAEVVFAVVADPARPAAIDGTGWVRGDRGRTGVPDVHVPPEPPRR